MSSKFTGTVTIDIAAPQFKVWKALTDPALIKQYLHGTNAISDWKAGSPLIFEGEWKGRSYVDKGVILEISEPERLKYSWLSSFSGLEDKEENYSIITYRLSEENGSTHLALTQENIPDDKSREASEKNWLAVLTQMKAILEQ